MCVRYAQGDNGVSNVCWYVRTTAENEVQCLPAVEIGGELQRTAAVTSPSVAPVEKSF